MSVAGGSYMLPEERQARARVAAHALHAQHDSTRITEAARKAFMDRFKHEVDPYKVLPPKERARRAEQARRSYFRALALRSAQARRRRRS
jgi:hypothetical protein